MPRSRARTVHSALVPIQLLPAELKQHIMVLAFTAPSVAVSALLGTMGLLVLNVFANDDDAQVNTAIYALSHGKLRCTDDMRYTSHCMYKLMDPHHAKSMALDFLDGLFHLFGTGELEYFLWQYDNLIPRQAPHLEPRYASNGWRTAKTLIYAAPRGQLHTDTHVYEGLLHAFDFNNDILHPMGIDRKSLSRITYHKNMAIPLLTYQKYEALLSKRDMGVFVAVVNVASFPVSLDQHGNSVGEPFLYLAPATCTIKNRQVFMSCPFMQQHICDVWREWPEESSVLVQ